MKYSKPRGTEDIYYEKFDALENLFIKLKKFSNNYNYRQIITPTFENINLFKTSIGNNTDIVTKEMFLLKNKSNDIFVLKPEGTASVARAIIENKLYNSSNKQIKFFYLDSLYRYERPQRGRLRQFRQFGIENIGIKNYLVDAETILFSIRCLEILGIKNNIVHINSLGNENTKKIYKEKLLKFLLQKEICNDCKIRINNNPLRILDCKKDQKEFIKIPKIYNFLEDKEKKYLDNIIKLLKINNINVVLNNNLVRGLDYYTEVVFEVSNDTSNWSQNTLIGGGRYDNLYKKLGGNDCPAFGFGMGIERVLILLENSEIKKYKNIDLFLISLSEKSYELSFKISDFLRKKNFIVEMNLDNTKSLKQQFKLSDKYNSKNVIIIGDKEVKENRVNIISKTNNKEIKNIEINKINKFL